MPSLYKSETKSWPIRDENDHYPTEPACVNFCTGILFSHLYLEADHQYVRLSDMGAGSGIWGASWRNIVSKFAPHLDHQLFGYEIRDIPDWDTTNYDIWQQVDIFDMTWQHVKRNSPFVEVAFGNPPYIRDWKLMYSKIIEMIESFDYTAFLLKDSFLAGQDRLNGLYFRNPPIAVWKAASRVSFSGDKSSNADEYVFIIWKKGYTGDTLYYWFNHRHSFVDPRFTGKILGRISRFGTAGDALRYASLFNPLWGSEYLKAQQDASENRVSQPANGENRDGTVQCEPGE